MNDVILLYYLYYFRKALQSAFKSAYSKGLVFKLCTSTARWWTQCVQGQLSSYEYGDGGIDCWLGGTITYFSLCCIVLKNASWTERPLRVPLIELRKIAIDAK